MTITRRNSTGNELLAAAVAAVLVAGSAMAIGAEPAGMPASSNVATAVADTAVTAKVKTGLMGREALKGSDISVNTANGVVVLTGTAMNRAAIRDAEMVARGVEGVASVTNRLQVGSPDTASEKAQRASQKAGRVVSDSWITTKVKSELLADSVSKGLDVKVETQHGIVTLTGSLPSKEAVDHVVQLAGRIEGVRRVEASGLVAARS